jgi:phosphatidylinositol alpha-mannosyltransferase
VRFLVLGRGDGDEALSNLPASARAAVELLGPLDDEDKAALLRSVDVYVAPHTGGESFGIVLVEAMSAGAAVLAGDLGAFRRVLDGGQLGAMFQVGDHVGLADQLLRLLSDAGRREGYVRRARAGVRRYDWSVVADQVLAVYETVRLGAERVGEDPAAGGLLARWLG